MINSFKGKYDFLSNFYNSPIIFNKKLINTVEHAYQASKTMDTDKFDSIIAVSTPGLAKKLGRSVKLREDWESIKLPLMRTLLTLKFAHNSDLADKLLNTNDQLLVEENYWGDEYWGTCGGKGLNWLGFLLMARRAELRGM